MSKFNSPLLFGCLVWIELREKRIELAIANTSILFSFDSFITNTQEYVPTALLQTQNSKIYTTRICNNPIRKSCVVCTMW